MLQSRAQRNAYRPLTCPPLAAARRDRLKMVLTARAQERDKWSRKIRDVTVNNRDGSATGATVNGVKRVQSMYHHKPPSGTNYSSGSNGVVNHAGFISRISVNSASDGSRRLSARTNHHSFSVRSHPHSTQSMNSFQAHGRAHDTSRLATTTSLHSNSTSAIRGESQRADTAARTKSALTRRHVAKDERPATRPVKDERSLATTVNYQSLKSKSSLFP